MSIRILVTNDDGFDSPGLRRLETALRNLGEVSVIAPEEERSASSHSLTLGRALRIRDRGENRFSLDGTPTDCVHLGITRILDRKPDLVVSGINQGFNLGEDITYSGTVAGALEGVLLGIPGLAVSRENSGESLDYGPAAAFAVQVAARILERGLPPDTLLNVNVPAGAHSGVRWTRQGRRRYEGGSGSPADISKESALRIRRNSGTWDDLPDSDYHAIRDRFISITPLRLDWTDYPVLKEISSWEFSVP
ncbi:MAG: 5'/3'-nucleotidase SurE [Acidobacteriota bacterium]